MWSLSDFNEILGLCFKIVRRLNKSVIDINKLNRLFSLFVWVFDTETIFYCYENNGSDPF